MVASKTKCARLLRKFSDRALIFGGESCFTFTFKDNGGYVTSVVSTAQPIMKFINNAKFEDKILVWITMDPKGLSRPFIRKSAFIVDGQWDLNKCIRHRLSSTYVVITTALITSSGQTSSNHYLKSRSQSLLPIKYSFRTEVRQPCLRFRKSIIWVVPIT